MIKKSLIKKVSILTVLALLSSSLSSFSSFANEPAGTMLENVLISEIIDGISIDINELDEQVLSKDFDLVEAVENIPSTHNMTLEEKELFDFIIDEQVALLEFENEEEEKLFEEALRDFFDENSETYNDLNSAMFQLEEEFYELYNEMSNEDIELSVTGLLNKVVGIETAHAFQVKVGVKFAGAVFNGAIGFAIGGGVGSIQAFILKKGKHEAGKLFTRTIVSRLTAWGAPKLALAVGSTVTVALNYLDVGNTIAKELDKRDKRPNNGWIDLY